MKLKAALLGLILEYFVELGVIKLTSLARSVKYSNPYLVVGYFFSLFLDITYHGAAFLIHIARYSLNCAYERKTLHIHFILGLVAPSLLLVKG